MSEDKPKYRFKKTSYTNSKWGRYDDKGISSKVKSEMIREMRGVIQALTSRIERFKWVIKQKDLQIKDLKKQFTADKNKAVEEAIKQTKREYRSKLTERTEEKHYKLRLKDTKIGSREVRIEKLTEELDKVKKELSAVRRREGLLERRLEKERTSHSLLKAKRKAETVVKEVIPTKVQRLNRLIEKSFSERGLNVMEMSSKLCEKLDEYGLTPAQWTVLLQTQMSGNLNTKELFIGNSKQMHSLKTKGLVNKTVAGKVYKGYRWFCTPSGEEVVKDTLDWVSYSKSKLKA